MQDPRYQPQIYARDASPSRQREQLGRQIAAHRGGRQLERAPRTTAGCGRRERVSGTTAHSRSYRASSADGARRVASGGCALSQLDSHIYISRCDYDRRRHSLQVPWCLACLCDIALVAVHLSCYLPCGARTRLAPGHAPLPYPDRSVCEAPDVAADSVTQCHETQKPLEHHRNPRSWRLSWLAAACSWCQ